ncbi:transglutaminase family protein [Homoserinibacter sp. YIM 151385]|uniref:transglutaminase family protein n=1 Tax=Homoserinibacter sp. YIM 151385 TaxID=2985506 RepID=UPI0022F082AA|nr:transglutaminase family protein [Homoserinibacter sp. YIM 151385]WBU37137.1 transglutaminase family protein [Homoserinibacter sp. YIM 151385]
MSRLRIRHETGFRYEGEAASSYNEARMLPQSSDGQLVLASALDIAPVSGVHDYLDYWGTRVSSFEVLTPHRELVLTATSLVEVRPRAHPEHRLEWTALADAADRSSELVEQLGQTARTSPPDEVRELAAGILRDAATPCEAALAIARAIGERIEYVPGSTTVTTTAAEAWAHRKGVCQDIAHLALGALRSAGIPARYVSGYLHPVPDAEIGQAVAGESHAWVEWYCGSWRGFDPTNLIDIGERHVTVGRGRDYADVPPLRGVYAGPTSSQLFVRVEITREA